MAKTIQELRRAAGYSSAKDFAAALDIPQSTYARYESQPDAIPLKQAWHIADFLNCSIDAVVGREHIEASEMRGEFQKLVDRLPGSYQDILWQISEIFLNQDALEKEGEHRDRQNLYDNYLRYYEQILSQSLVSDDSAGEIYIFGSFQERRDFFHSYLLTRSRLRRQHKIDEIYSRKLSSLLLDGDSIRAAGGEIISKADNRYERELERLAEEILNDAAEEVDGDDKQVINELLYAFDRKYASSADMQRLRDQNEQAMYELRAKVSELIDQEMSMLGDGDVDEEVILRKHPSQVID